MSKPFKFIVSAFLLLLLACVFLTETVPPRSETYGRMFITKRRIIQYARQHNQLPPTLAVLPAMAGYGNETTDVWKRPLDYGFDSSGIVTLQSLGADKRPGGDGDKRDMTGVFASRDAQGNWQDELAEWEQNPFKP